MEKYILTNDTIKVDNSILHRIRALRDFDGVKAGEFGGYIENEYNLNHEGNCWVDINAKLYNNAYVSGNSVVIDFTVVNDNALIDDNSLICGNSIVKGNAWVKDGSVVEDNAQIDGYATIESAWICGDADIKNYDDYLCFKGFGSKNRNTTIFRTNNGICVKCGCFYGTLSEFEAKVKETHGNSKYTREYSVCIEATKIHFDIK